MSMTITLSSIKDNLPELYARCLFVDGRDVFVGHMAEDFRDLSKNVIVVEHDDVPVPIESFANLHFKELC